MSAGATPPSVARAPVTDEPIVDRAVVPASRRPLYSTLWSMSGVVVVTLIVLAIFAPYFAPHSISAMVGPPYAKPGSVGVLGTDYLGHDLFSRLLVGGRTLILLSILCTLAASVLGTVLGLVAGYRGGWVDSLVSRILDLLLILPPIVVLLVITAGSTGGTTRLIPVIMISASPYVARIVRAATLSVARRAHVEAAILRGESSASILLREVLPNVAGPVLAVTGLLLIYSIFVIATAGFLGVGAQPPTADWALMIKENMVGVTLTAWPVALPAVCILVLAISVNVFADRLHRHIAGGRS